MNEKRSAMLRRILPGLRGAVGALLIASLLSSCVTTHGTTSDQKKHWVGTWATAPQLVEVGNNPPPPGLSNNTLRQIVRVSIGGDSLRVRFSNAFSTEPVILHAVHIALSTGGGTIDPGSDRALAFDGKEEIVIAPGATVTSDPLAFPLTSRADVAITTFYGPSPVALTGHPGSRTTSYLFAGNALSRVDTSGSVRTDHWYTINAIDVLAPVTAACVAILGNSITDGRGSTTNMQNRWPDILSESLQKDARTQHVGVLNLGIGGNCVLAGGLGPTGASRFERDILGQSGVRWAVVFEGVNDIGKVKTAAAAAQMATDLIASYKEMVARARAKNIRIYGGTILPFNGNGYFNQYSEQCRAAVNEWIRGTGNFDACIDMDMVMRDPRDPTQLLLPAYQNDGLHPDAAGYRLMGSSVDHRLFAAPAAPEGRR